jgi:hypothetical protein
MPASDFDVRTTQVAITPKGEPIFSERSTVIEVMDEGAGQFLSVTQGQPGLRGGEIRIDPEEWEIIKDTINSVIKTCEV